MGGRSTRFYMADCDEHVLAYVDSKIPPGVMDLEVSLRGKIAHVMSREGHQYKITIPDSVLQADLAGEAPPRSLDDILKQAARDYLRAIEGSGPISDVEKDP